MDCQNLPGKLNCEMNHIRICLTTLSTSQCVFVSPKNLKLKNTNFRSTADTN